MLTHHKSKYTIGVHAIKKPSHIQGHSTAKIMFEDGTEATFNTEAKRCFATHDEDIDYFKDSSTLYIYINRIYSIACVYIQQFNFVQ